MSDDQRFAEMISKIAHELRSPLTSVKGFSSTLIKRWDKFTDEQKFQFVETINADADRMGRIVSEVLDLARLETGRFELRAIEIEIKPVAEKAAGNHSDLPGADRVEVTIPEGLKAWADPDRLGHVLTNMIENALKFSDDGPIEVAGRPVDVAAFRALADATGDSVVIEYGGGKPKFYHGRKSAVIEATDLSRNYTVGRGAFRAPAITPGIESGSVTRRKACQRLAYRSVAASMSRRSIFSSATYSGRAMNGRKL